MGAALDARIIAAAPYIYLTWRTIPAGSRITAVALFLIDSGFVTEIAAERQKLLRSSRLNIETVPHTSGGGARMSRPQG